MTIIASDGETIASDSLVTSGYKRPWDSEAKFRVVNGRVYALAGAQAWCEAFVAWHSKGGKGARPNTQDEARVVVITRNSVQTHYAQQKYPDTEACKWAAGSGSPYAITALALGHCALVAVEIAVQLDPYCGGVIFAAKLKDLFEHGEEAIKPASAPSEWVRRIRKA